MTNAAIYNSAVSIRSNVTKTGYAEMQESIIEDTKFDDKDLPTYHMLKNLFPEIICLSIIPLNSHSNDFPILEVESLLNLEAENQSQLCQLQHEKCLNNLEVVIPLMAEKIKGTYSNYDDHMTKKFK